MRKNEERLIVIDKDQFPYFDVIYPQKKKVNKCFRKNVGPIESLSIGGA